MWCKKFNLWEWNGKFLSKIVGLFEHKKPKFVYVDKLMTPPSPHVGERRHLATLPFPLACLRSLCMAPFNVSFFSRHKSLLIIHRKYNYFPFEIDLSFEIGVIATSWQKLSLKYMSWFHRRYVVWSGMKAIKEPWRGRIPVVVQRVVNEVEVMYLPLYSFCICPSWSQDYYDGPYISMYAGRLHIFHLGWGRTL